MKQKKLYQYIIPGISAMAGISCYILADTYFISAAAGADGITALNLTLPIYGLMFAIGSMIGTGAATKYSLLTAAGKKEAGSYFSNSLIWCTLISIIFIAGGLFFPDDILRVMGGDERIIAAGSRYLGTALSFAPFFLMNYTFTSFVRNDSNPGTAMAATIASSVFNILFDYIFMFPMNMGMQGAALATGLAPGVSMLICLTHYLSKKNHIHFRFQIPDIRILASSCSLGTAAFVGEIAGSITTLVFNYLLLKLSGNTAVAAYGIVANISLVGTAIFNGISQGLQPMVSEAHAAGDQKTENDIYRKCIILGLVIAAAMISAVCAGAAAITDIFNSGADSELSLYAVSGIRLYITGFAAASVNIVRTGFFSASDNGFTSSVIALSRGVFSIILFAFILSNTLGMTGIWLSYPAAELFTLLITLRAGKKKIRQNIYE